MKKFRVIDADGHLMEVHPDAVQWKEAFPPELRHRAPKFIPFTTGGGRLFMEGKIWPEPFPGADVYAATGDNYDVHFQRPGMWDPKKRLPDMDTDGIDTAVLFGGVMALYCSFVKDRQLALAVARAINNWATDYCKAAPERLKGVVVLPLQSPEDAIGELRRGVTELGLVGAHFPTQVQGKNLDHPDLYPVYAEAQRLGVPICYHGGYANPGAPMIGADRAPSQFYLNLATFPFELIFGMATVLCGGVADRFPTLKFGFLEGNCGWLPWYVGRMDEHFEKMGNQVACKKKPSAYLEEKRFVVTCDYDEKHIAYVVQTVGADMVMYASDYWHVDAKFPGTVASIADRKELSDEVKRKVLGENALRFYGLNGSRK